MKKLIPLLSKSSQEFTLELKDSSGKTIFTLNLDPSDLDLQLKAVNDVIQTVLGLERGDAAAKLILSNRQVNALIAALLNPLTNETPFEEIKKVLEKMSASELTEAVELLPTEMRQGLEAPVHLDVLSKVTLKIGNGSPSCYLDLEPRVGVYLSRALSCQSCYYLSLVTGGEKNTDFTGDNYTDMTQAIGLIILTKMTKSQNIPYVFFEGKPYNVFNPEVDQALSLFHKADEAVRNRGNAPTPLLYAVRLNGDYRDKNLEVQEEDSPLVRSLKLLIKLLDVLFNIDIKPEERSQVLKDFFGISFSDDLEVGYEVMGIFEELIKDKYEQKLQEYKTKSAQKQQEYESKMQEELQTYKDEAKEANDKLKEANNRAEKNADELKEARIQIADLKAQLEARD